MDISSKEGGSIADWYFGTIHYRLNPGNWIRGGWHFMSYVVGNFGLVFLALAAVRLRKISEIWLWILAAVCTTMVFTPLILGHTHYFFVFSSAFALLCASAAHAFEDGAWQRLQLNVLGRFVLVMAAIMFSLAQSTQTIHFSQFFDPWNDESARIIKEHTAPTDKIVVWGAVWCKPFARCERDGLTGGFSTKNIGWLNDSKKLARLKELGYTRLVLMNPSPYMVALTTATGSQREQAMNLVDELPDAAKNWPVLFSSPQILILQIPK
jgi:hypothetical protein